MSDLSFVNFPINQRYKRRLTINTFESDHIFVIIKTKNMTIYKRLEVLSIVS